MRRSAVLGLAIASLAWTASTAAAAPGPRLLREDVTAHFAVRPATLFFGCCGQFVIGGPKVSSRAFRSGRLGHIRWSRWGAVARGTGLLWIDGCKPDCARGTFHSRPVSIAATRVRAGRYTRLLLVYRRNGRETRDQLTLKRLSGASAPAYDWV